MTNAVGTIIASGTVEGVTCTVDGNTITVTVDENVIAESDIITISDGTNELTCALTIITA